MRIFIEQPIVGLVAAVAVLFSLVQGVFAARLPAALSKALLIITVLLHIAALTLTLLCGGGYESALILVLLSCVITLLATPLLQVPTDGEVKE